MTTQCSYCKKYEYPDGWKDNKPSGAVEGIEGNISHGICPECLEKQMKEVEG